MKALLAALWLLSPAAASAGVFGGQEPTDGGAAPDVAASLSKLTGGLYNASLPAPTSGQQCAFQSDYACRQIVTTVPLDGAKATYAAFFTGLATAASATDIACLVGSATKTVRVVRVLLSGATTSGSGAAFNVTLIKRSSTDTGGTSAALTLVPLDANDAAATASAVSYTVNPTLLGTAVGNLRSRRLSLESSGVVADSIEWDFGAPLAARTAVLRGTSQALCLNFGAFSITGPSLSGGFEFTEE